MLCPGLLVGFCLENRNYGYGTEYSFRRVRACQFPPGYARAARGKAACRQCLGLAFGGGARLGAGEDRALLSATVAPGTFPVAMAVGMGLLWAQMHGYLHVPVSVCDWTALIGK